MSVKQKDIEALVRKIGQVMEEVNKHLDDDHDEIALDIVADIKALGNQTDIYNNLVEKYAGDNVEQIVQRMVERLPKDQANPQEPEPIVINERPQSWQSPPAPKVADKSRRPLTPTSDMPRFDQEFAVGMERKNWSYSYENLKDLHQHLDQRERVNKVDAIIEDLNVKLVAYSQEIAATPHTPDLEPRVNQLIALHVKLNAVRDLPNPAAMQRQIQSAARDFDKIAHGQGKSAQSIQTTLKEAVKALTLTPEKSPAIKIFETLKKTLSELKAKPEIKDIGPKNK